MNDIVPISVQLPVAIEDLAKFVLVGQEKLISVRAEIRAISKLDLAEHVLSQKLEEGQMIAEAVLDAKVKIGNLTQQMPKSMGGRPAKPSDSVVERSTEESTDTAVASFESDTDVTFEKPKQEAIRELGFTPKQIERYEVLAKNPDLVEQVKAEARENKDMATQSAVLSLAKERDAHVAAVEAHPVLRDLPKMAAIAVAKEAAKLPEVERTPYVEQRASMEKQYADGCKQIDDEHKLFLKLIDATSILCPDVTDETLDHWMASSRMSHVEIDNKIMNLSTSIDRLMHVRTFFVNRRGKLSVLRGGRAT